MRRVQVLVFGFACLSLILGTTLLVLEIVKPRTISEAGPFWKDFDTSLAAGEYALSWTFLETRIPPVLDRGSVPQGTVSRLWQLWSANKDIEALRRTLNSLSANLNNESAARIALLLLEAGRTEEAGTYFSPDRFVTENPYLADELSRIRAAAKPVASKDFGGFTKMDAGYLLDRGVAAAYLGDLELSRALFENARQESKQDPEVASSADVQLMRVLWDLEDDEALEKLMLDVPFPAAIARDASFVADLSTLGVERIRQAEIYHQLISTGWTPGDAHAENIKLLKDYVPGAMEILKDDKVSDSTAYESERALLLNPEQKDIRSVVSTLRDIAIEKKDPRLLRLSLWYLYSLGDDAAYHALLTSKNLAPGAWLRFYDAVSLNDADKAFEDLKLVRRGILAVSASLNRVRLLVLRGQVAEAGAQLDRAMQDLSRESRGLDVIYAGFGLDRPEPSTPYALLRADGLALRSVIERLTGRPEAVWATLRELHDLDPGHPIFSRAGGIDLSATDIFGPDAEEYYHDAPKE